MNTYVNYIVFFPLPVIAAVKLNILANSKLRYNPKDMATCELREHKKHVHLGKAFLFAK